MIDSIGAVENPIVLKYVFPFARIFACQHRTKVRWRAATKITHLLLRLESLHYEIVDVYLVMSGGLDRQPEPCFLWRIEQGYVGLALQVLRSLFFAFE